MLAWSPILVQKIEIHALGFVLQKLQLNRHRDTEVSSHHHDYAQAILYLSGEGLQTVSGRRYRAHPGDLFMIPAGTPHGFLTAGRSRPLCLVLDYRLEGSRGRRAWHRRLPPDQLNDLHAALTRLPAKGRLTLADYSTLLAVVARLLDARRAPAPAPAPPNTFDRVRDLLQSPGPLHRIARRAGYHPDHLTRKLKREAGLGLRGLRDRLRLAAAEAALRESEGVGVAATQAGFEDPNYFARWFRRQTGQTPSAWRAQRNRRE